MTGPLISPNWHPILVHYPLGLLTMGILMEVFNFLWKSSGVRTAGRWMIFLGAVAMVPAMTSGMYAFQDAARRASSNPDGTWKDLVAGSQWQESQWNYMLWHIRLTILATILSLGAVLAWVASSDDWRRRLHLPLVVAVILGVGSAGAGAWFSGEGVYRTGIAVGQPAALEQDGAAAFPEKLKAAIPPLQVHVVAVGFMIGLAGVAIALTLRRWAQEPEEIALAPRSSIDAVAAAGSGTLPATPMTLPPAVYPVRVWALVLLAGVVTAGAGLWFSEEDWGMSTLRGLFKDSATRNDNRMMFYHVLLGSAIVVMVLISLIMARFARRARLATLVILALLLLAVGFQVWVGAILLYGLFGQVAA